MAFPAGWPPRPSSGLRSIRFFASGTATANYFDNAFIFAQGAGANTFTPTPVVPPGGERVTANIGSPPEGGGQNYAGDPVPMIWSHSMRIVNDGGADLTFSFDGVNTHGIVKTGEDLMYFDRFEGGVAVKGTGAFRIEAW